LKYWRRKDYIGLGPSAHSYFRGFKARNPKSIDLWKKSLQNGRHPSEETLKETEEEKVENEIIFGLRLKEGLEYSVLEDYCNISGGEILRVEKLLQSGYLKRDGSRISLTEESFLVSNEVIAFILSDKSKWRMDGLSDD
ncbi:MAG: hypothetical protein N2445_08385, partial [Acidobacteria bacterium]|nr:hypothetical protein [Acidobacteriota bacterium]